MDTRKLAGLEPQAVFHYFEDICAIPHGSYNTKAISDYLVDFAKKNAQNTVKPYEVVFKKGQKNKALNKKIIKD